MDNSNFSRREFLRLGTASVALASTGTGLAAAAATPAAPVKVSGLCPLITPAADFRDVSRGNPKPYTLTGAAQAEARLTAETWRLEVTADPFVEEPHTKLPASLQRPLTLADGTALDLPALMALGRKHEVHFIKAMQCLNIETPLGQGVWSGVPLREVLRLCGRMENVRRIYFWGYHNNDPKQVFKSSVSYTQCMETAPGDLPVFLAYRLNGEPLPPMRGGPVRMVVPWSYGFKSIKWLQHIFVTNDPRNNDTYAIRNNDPDSLLKSAAYVDQNLDNQKFKVGEPIMVTGQVISGPSGVRRVEYWLRRIEGTPEPLAGDAPELLRGPWLPCTLEPQPDWRSLLPRGLKPQNLLGFDQTTGQARSWPPRFGMCSYSALIRDCQPGHYEVRVRSVDLNDFAQPEPRPWQKNGKNAIQVRRFEVV